MSWASSPTIPTRTPSRGWFGTPPTPAAREHQLYWRQLVEAVWSATLPALSAALLGEHHHSGSLEATLRRTTAAITAQHQQTGVLGAALRRIGFLATDITMGELHATGRPATAALTGQQTMAGVMGAATQADHRGGGGAGGPSKGIFGLGDGTADPGQHGCVLICVRGG